MIVVLYLRYKINLSHTFVIVSRREDRQRPCGDCEYISSLEVTGKLFALVRSMMKTVTIIMKEAVRTLGSSVWVVQSGCYAASPTSGS